ncbi:hypothetical protein J7L36_02410 [bacterium]|nr:hypothetical protein [bacterium]
MSRSALTQAIDQVRYAYPYGKGTPSSQFLVLTIESIMNQMAATLNTYAVAPLIDFNFKTSAYPEIKFEKISDVSQEFLREVFSEIMKARVQLPEGFINQVIDETARNLNLKWAFQEKEENREAVKEFERGKLEEANKLKIKAPRTPRKLKEKLLRVKKGQKNIEKCYKLGKEFAYVGKTKENLS